MTARKVGNYIYIEGDGNTLASVTADLNDPTWMEEVSPGVFEIKQNVNRYTYIRPGGTLTIGDPDDYSVSETLQVDTNTANYGRFYVNAGASLLQYGNTVLNFSSGSQRSYYGYMYGKINVWGNDTYQPIWQNYQRLYFYETNTGNSYPNDIWHFEKMILGGSFATNYYGFFFSSIGKMRPHIFRDITIDWTLGGNASPHAMYFNYGYPGSHQITLERIDFVNCGYPAVNYGASVKWKDCTFRTTSTYKGYNMRTQLPDPSFNFRDDGITNEPQAGQVFTLYEGCTFTPDGYAHAILSGFSGNVVVKDCDFQRTASGYYYYAYYNGRIRVWTGNSEAKASGQYNVSSTGAIQWVHGLDVLVQDVGGNPIEGATVTCVQSEGKERWTFVTDATGHLVTYHDIGVALLTHRHQYGANKVTQSELWSDESNDTYHTITASAGGYAAVSDTVVMDDEKSVTITLPPAGGIQIGSTDSINCNIIREEIACDINTDEVNLSIDMVEAEVTEVVPETITANIIEQLITKDLD